MISPALRSLRTFDTYSPGKLGFYAVWQLLDATWTFLTNTGAIAVDASDQSRPGQEIFKSLPHLGSYCYPLKVASNLTSFSPDRRHPD